MSERKHPIGKKWIDRRTVFVLIAIVAMGMLFSWWTLRHTDRCMRESVLYQARLVAEAIRPERIAALSGTPADLTSPAYHQLKAQLATTRATIPDCRFIYLLGRRTNNSVFLFMDSEPPGSADESTPGQTYPEITDSDLQVFTRQFTLVSGPAEDRWGISISALIPILHPDSKRLTAVLGMDFVANDWQRRQVRAALPQILLTLLMVLVLVVGAILFRHSARCTDRSRFKRRYREAILTIAVLGIFFSISAAWLVGDTGSLIRLRIFRQLAHDKSARLAGGLQSLQYIELEALTRFFQASQYVSTAEFRKFIEFLLKNPVIQYWAWAKWTPRSDRNELTMQMRAEGRPDAMIWQHGEDGRRIAATAGDISFPIVHEASRMKDRDLLGYDLGSDARRRIALETAMQSGLTTCIVQMPAKLEAGGPLPIEIYSPAFSQDGMHRPLGVGMAVLMTGKLLSSARPNNVVQLKLALGKRAGTAIEILATSWNTDSPPDSVITIAYPIFAFGKALLLTAHAGRAYKGLYPSQVPWLVLFTGVMLTVLSTVLVAVTYRKRAQLEFLVAEHTRDLIDARYRMELAINGAELGTWEWLIPADSMTVNDNWIKMLGYGREEIGPLLDDYQQLTVPADRPEVTRAMRLHLKSQTDFYEIEHRLRHKAGHDVWVLSKGRVIERDADGRPVRVCGTCLDTTKHRAVKEALKISETRLRTLIDTLPDLVWLKDVGGVFLACNKRFERLYGAKEADIVGKTDYDFVDRKLADFFREKDREAMAAGKPCLNEEEVAFTDDGHKELLETIKTPMFDPQGCLIGVLGIARDITERRRAQEEREKLQGQLLQSQKIEAVGQLAGGVAHDLNNLLSPIIGYSELLRTDLDRGDHRYKAVDAILNAGFRARDLVHQLLAFSRKQTLVFKPINLNLVIEEFENLLRRAIPEDITMEIALATQTRSVMADAGQIEQVIMNLVVNAADAMPNGGRLTLETAMVELDDAYAATHPTVRPGPHLMLAITDTGYGMDEATRQRIFEPFFSTKGERGTGLGLATVFGIVKQHNGSIWVYSESGKGTSFKVYLPTTDTTAKEEEAVSQAAGDLTGDETIMLVEDNQQVRELARDILSHKGYTILPAATGEEALALVVAHQGPLHLLLTDVVMPGMNGKALYREASVLHPGLKVLYMSGYTDNVIAQRGVLDSGVAFIQKPFTVQAIAAKVRAVLDHP
jgi:PAS domain S-box-containing protein